MKRYFYRTHKEEAARGLFGWKEDFDLCAFDKYGELEVVLQDDGRYSVWGNFTEDTDLLQDTRRDSGGLFAAVEGLADEVVQED